MWVLGPPAGFPCSSLGAAAALPVRLCRRRLVRGRDARTQPARPQVRHPPPACSSGRLVERSWRAVIWATARDPVILGPVGLAGMYARHGEVQAARAAWSGRVPFCLSTVSVCSLGEVSAGAGAASWFQLYVIRDRGFMTDLLARASGGWLSRAPIHRRYADSGNPLSRFAFRPIGPLGGLPSDVSREDAPALGVGCGSARPRRRY
jgi:hypothetical protein